VVSMKNKTQQTQQPKFQNITREHPLGIGMSILLSMVESASLLPLAMFVNRVFDQYIPIGNVTGLYKTLGIITSLLLLNAVMQLLNKRLTLNIIKSSIAHLRKSLIRSILSYSRLHLSQKDRDAGCWGQTPLHKKRANQYLRASKHDNCCLKPGKGVRPPFLPLLLRMICIV